MFLHLLKCFTIFVGGDDSSESETDNNEDSITCVKFLLLVDQLSIDQHHHLSIKDIGMEYIMLRWEKINYLAYH